jgi:hypothetical protein
MSEQNPFASEDGDRFESEDGDRFESEDGDRFESEERDVVPEKKGLSGCAIAAIGCGVIVLLGMIAAGIAVWWVSQNFREFGTDFAVIMMKEGLKELDVPDDQRQRMHARIDEIGKQFKEGKLTDKQVTSIFENIMEGPLLPAGISLFVKRVYIRDSGLDEEEKAAAHLAIQRYSRGVIDQSIPDATQQAVLDRISTRDFQGNRQFKQLLTDDELRAFIDAAKKAADDAEVANDVPEINFADEFDKAIDEALGQVGGAVEAQAGDAVIEEVSVEEPDEVHSEALGEDDGPAPEDTGSEAGDAVPSEVGAEALPETTE